MPITALSPDALLASANLRDAAAASPPEALADLGDDPASPDADWWSPVDPAETASARFGFPAPAGLLSGEQAVRVLLRKSTGDGTPRVTLSLYEDGVLVRHLLSGVDVTETGGQLLTGTFDASEISDPAAVEIGLTMTLAPPVALGAGTWAVTQSGGEQTFDASALFSGLGVGYTIFEITGAPSYDTFDPEVFESGVFESILQINSLTGALTAQGNDLPTMEGVVITIRATNSGGFADENVNFSVVAPLYFDFMPFYEDSEGTPETTALPFYEEAV